MGLPSTSTPFMASIAAVASSSEPTSTNPNPRERSFWGVLMMTTLFTRVPPLTNALASVLESGQTHQPPGEAWVRISIPTRHLR
jgi:hypothetical protein